MVIYPAIDIKGGRAVRLEQGAMDRSTDYGDPCLAAKKWQDSGAQYIHLVDLDGAIAGNGANLDSVRQVVHAVDVPVQMGGGIRRMEDIEIRLDEIGVSRVILGTVATSDPVLVREACKRWPGRIVVGMDVREGMLAVRGWMENTKVTPADIIPMMRDAGVDTIVYTDIRRDGMMGGPNIEKTGEIVEKFGMNVIASGGISSLNDIAAVKKIGCAGVIVGKALYMGLLKLEDALKV
jgi:phosphoribosylformimino-5-aminoimidazole carboxamide ribotide isomerase